MTISIITPSYGQLDWLKLCVASVADQVGTQNGGWRMEDESLGGDAPAAQGVRVAESRAGKIANSSSEIVDLKGGSAGNPQQSAIRTKSVSTGAVDYDVVVAPKGWHRPPNAE